MSKQVVRLFVVLLVAAFIMSFPGAVRAIPIPAGRSAVVDDDVFLEGMYLSVGISGAGSFGTYNAAPAGFHPTPYYSGRIGLSVDQDGFDTGNPPTTGDFFLPGTPEERFVVGYKIGGVPSVFNNAETMGDEDVIKSSVTDLSSGGVLSARWVGSTSDGNKLLVTQTVQFQSDKRFFRNTITLRNTGTVPLDSVRYMRNVDPDQDQDVGGTFTTDNEIVVQQTADGKALVRATGLKSGVSIFYYSADTRARVSTFGFSNTNPFDAAAYDNAGVYNSSTYLGAKGSVVQDQAISICADLGTLEPGQQQTFVYYTSLDADFQDSLDDIEDETVYVIRASAGAGGTIDPAGDIQVLEGGTASFTVSADARNSIRSVVVDGSPVSIPSRSTMTYAFSGVVADHTITASFVRRDTTGPVIELPDGMPPAVVGSPHTLHLLVTDDRPIADVGIYENGTRIGGSTTGGDIHVPLTLANGRNDLVIVALDVDGQRTEKAVTLTVDTHGPTLNLSLPTTVSSPNLAVKGSTVDAVSGLKSLTIDGAPIIPFLDGSFEERLTLAKGFNTIVVEAVDNVGNTTSQTFTVTYSSPSSSAPSSLYVVLTIGSKEMNVNGMARSMDAAPVIKNGRTLLPIRALIETLGGKVAWDAKTRTATVALGEHTVVLVVGKNTALVDGKSVAIDAANSKVVPEIIGSRTFLPLRFIAENLGLDLTWEPISQTISFTYWP